MDTFESLLRTIIREELRAALAEAAPGVNGLPSSGDVEVSPLTLSPAQVAALTGIAEQTLSNWRSTSTPARPLGPPSFKLGRLVRYNPDELATWLTERREVTGR